MTDGIAANSTLEFRFQSHSEADTEQFAIRLAKALVPGTIIALVGNLGAGKTRLVRGIATALGVDPREIASPTFVLLHEYNGRLPLYHFDIYRLKDPIDFLDLGADEYFDAGGVCLIEWADRVALVLPTDRLQIEIRTTGETSRDFRIRAGGSLSQAIVARLAEN